MENFIPWLRLLPCSDEQGLATLIDRAAVCTARYISFSTSVRLLAAASEGLMPANNLQQGHETTTAHLAKTQHSIRQTLTMLPQGRSNLPWHDTGAFMGSSAVAADEQREGPSSNLRGPLRRCSHCAVSQLYVPAQGDTASGVSPLPALAAPDVPCAGVGPVTESLAAGALQCPHNACTCLLKREQICTMSLGWQLMTMAIGPRSW